MTSSIKVKYINEDNQFGYLKLDDVKFVRSMDKKNKEEDLNNADSL